MPRNNDAEKHAMGPLAEIRSFDFDVSAESTQEGKRTLRGRAIVYGVRTNLGPFDEIIEPGALAGTDLRDVRLLVNHNTNMIPLARSRNNNKNSSMQLSPVPEGLDIRADLDTANNLDARSLSSAVDRGDISGMSFRMGSVKDRWEGLGGSHPTRHILSIGRILEVSVATFPAYAQTAIESRDIPGALESAQEVLERAKAAYRARERQKQKIRIMMEV